MIVWLWWCPFCVNPLTPRSDWHVTSSYNIHKLSEETGCENTQTYQEQDITLIKHQILITNLQGNV